MKVTNFKEFSTTIIYNLNSYACSKYTWSLFGELLGLFQSSKTASLAASIVAEGSVLDKRPSGSGRLLDTGLKYR